MGCRSSRLDAEDVSPAAALCRERRDLLRVAAERRAQLAAAHVAYFHALPRVADALARFASHHHAATPSGSPVLTLPPSDPDEPKKPSGSGSASTTPHTDSGHSHIHFHSDDASDSDPDSPDTCAAPGGCGGGHGEISPPTLIFRSGVPLSDHGHGEPQERQVHQPGADMPEMPWEYASDNPYPSFRNATFQDGTFPSYYYMKASSTPANTVYQEPYSYGNFATNASYTGYNYGYNNPMYGVPGPLEGDRPVEGNSREAAAPALPPPMPMPETSPWDFFNPFDSYEQELPQYKGKGYDSNGSFTSSPNSSELRAREGIPELEEETELESMRESVKARKAVESTASNRIDNVDVSAKAKVSMEHKECEIESVDSASVPESGEESVCSCDRDHDNARTGRPVPVGDDQGKVKKVSLEEHSSMVVGEDVRSPESTGTRDVAEVVEEIKEQFNSVAACGEDVARILEVGRMRHRSQNRILRLIFSRMMGAFTVLFSSISESPVKNVEQSAISASKRNQNSSKRIDFSGDIELNTLSATMDRLYVWEKRLHKEIMEEERLRITYDKEWKRLKELDASGAEPYKIDTTRASIRTLLTRINIAIRSAKVISRQIHILRDDELHPHLVKLIQGLVRMWKFILECHRKQFHTILETKSHILIPKNGPERSTSKVTLELEMELLNWCSCFRNWILSQKAYIETLNGWLIKWLPQEKEETLDGIVPFSPGKLGAPAVFITANDWCQAMKRISEGTVVDTMEAFAVNVHILWERQDEEQKQKLKADYLSRDFAKRLKSLQKEHGLQGYFEADKTVLPIADKGRAVDNSMVALGTLHKRLDEQRARHEETVKQIREASATDLKAGLAPIFEALESFTQETLRGYENVRIPTESGGA
ncbi:protein ROLLING AND ERECT LEAF 2-like [Phragmites australis]|uniref:protein ROLLING AND ERECT LEAF 2-like n=1 Tax=Phragmites australis TaxID=29695 RepID=UPI002D776F75|nr:protein ROLLING AND ERECT LEAF 2-like [Phragmites australis]